MRNYATNDTKMWMGVMVLLSAHHFLIYAREVADELEQECQALKKQPAAVEMPQLSQVG